MRRLLACTALLALALGAWAASASATTVYDYTYSGSFVDGSAAGKKFDSNLGGIFFDGKQQQLFVTNGASEAGWISKYSASGSAVNFSGLGSPILTTSNNPLGSAQIAVDERAGPLAGNIYVGTVGGFGAGGSAAFHPDGTAITPFSPFNSENFCGMAVPPTGEELIVMSRNGLYRYTPNGVLLKEEDVGSPGYQTGVKVSWEERGQACLPVIDGEGSIYGIKTDPGPFGGGGNIVKLNSTALEDYELNQGQDSTGVAIDQSDNDPFVLKSGGSFEQYDSEGRLLGSGFGVADPGHSYEGLEGAYGITVDPQTHDVWVANKHSYGGFTRVEKFVPSNPHVIPTVTALEPGYNSASGDTMKLRGTVDPEGKETTDCHFDWGQSQELNESVPCDQGNTITGSGPTEVTATVPTAKKGVRYFYKLSAHNSNGQVALSNTKNFLPQGKPKVSFLAVDRVNTDGARFLVEFDPNGGNASYHFEWGTNGNFESSNPESETFGFTSDPGIFSGSNKYEPGVKSEASLITGLTPGLTYELRVKVTNEAGTTTSEPQEFTTYKPDASTDPCPNAQVRQETEGSLLPDCRAYELVSAPDTGGYDVESNLVPGQEPLPVYPRAGSKFLYSVHFGVIPGISGSPTNDGRDPYVSTRGADGWTTKYVGLPANGMSDEGAFGSPLLGADESLDTFAFGGPSICEPCFEDGSTNVPLRRSDGSLEKGMAGGANPPANPVGEVREALSSDGSHLVFGANEPFAAGAPPEGTLAFYERDLNDDTTQIVSTDSSGTPLSGQLAELAVSADGSRVLIGKLVGEDADGNQSFDLYMHVGDDPDTVKVVESPHGVVFNGMTSDGGHVFFTTSDRLAGDTDTSADFFRADVPATGTATVTRLSSGIEGTGNTDACTPTTNWNVVSGGPDCSTVALAGGAGIASGDGTAYFVSPETLDGLGNGEAGQVNLYVVTAGTSTPKFVGVLDSSTFKPPPAAPLHVLKNPNFLGGLTSPESIAVDQNSGDVYVAEPGAGRVSRWTSSGAADKFSSLGSNQITGQSLGGSAEGQIAVDSSSSPFRGDLYVTTNSSGVNVFASSGEQLGELTIPGENCGVAVDQSNGDVYVGTYGETITRFRPKPAAANSSITNASYEAETGIHASVGLCNIDVSAEGHVYAWPYTGGGINQYETSAFTASPFPSPSGKAFGNGLNAQSDPDNGDLYVDEGGRVSRYDSEANAIETFGSGALTGSHGIGVNGKTGDVYASSSNSVADFELFTPPYEPIDDPAVVHGVKNSGKHYYEDFQVTPDGRYAIFTSVAPLTGYPNLGHTEIFRYDTSDQTVTCISCAPTGAVGGSNVKLTNSGPGLTDDGRVFFSTTESLALRDTNEKQDAYEWNNGKTSLISSGIGQYDSGLAGVSADGTDAYFFTRDTLSPFDTSGNVIKVYTAHVEGGSPFDQPRQPCKASDECHGAGTEAPPAPNIQSKTGTEAPPPPPGKTSKCRKGLVKRKGKCVKRPAKHKKKHRKHRHHSTRGNG